MKVRLDIWLFIYLAGLGNISIKNLRPQSLEYGIPGSQSPLFVCPEAIFEFQELNS